MVEFPLTNPPTRLFAYVNSHPADQVMGVVIDGRTGKTIEATILPTKQRVMLGLGVGNDQAHAHHHYRRLYPHGYRLIWTDDPHTDVRLAGLKGRLEKGAGELQETGTIVSESEVMAATPQPTLEVDPALPQTGQLTADLIRGGVEKAKSTPRQSDKTDDSDRANVVVPERTVVPEQPPSSDTDTERGDPPPAKPTAGWF